MSILGWTLKLFNKSVACRPKCYTLIYDAWGASLSSPSETAAKWRSRHLGLFRFPSQAIRIPTAHSMVKCCVRDAMCFMSVMASLVMTLQIYNVKMQKSRKKSCTGHVFSESVSQSTQD